MRWFHNSLLSCYIVTNEHFYLPENNSKIINNIPSTVLTILPGWPYGLRHWLQVPVISMAWFQIPFLSSYTVTNELFYWSRNNSNIINNIPSTVLTILSGWLRSHMARGQTQYFMKFFKISYKVRNSVNMAQILTICSLSSDKSKVLPNLHIDHVLFAK